jgi:Icc-related predicted phosphoesterase
LKDWEKYDVSRYTPPGSVSPEEGRRSVRVDRREVRHATIWNDLQQLAGGDDLTGAILLFHSPPNETNLDRAALDGKMIDHVPLDLHVGSIAVRRFIEMKQPLITLHGHIHESTRLTGSWHDRIGRTFMVNGSHDGEELSLITFDPGEPENTTRELL